MKIRVLGTRGEIEQSAPRHSRHSGLLIDGHLLFDLGERGFLKTRPWRVFITHLHPDHAYFVRKREPLGIRVFAPEKRAGFPEVDSFPGKTLFRGYSIRAVPTHHSLKARSTAYIIEKDGQKLLCTGDMFWISKEYYPLLKGLDLVVTEASFIREGGIIRRDRVTREPFGHTGVPNLIKLFAKFTGIILFMHFGSWFYGDARKSRRMLAEMGKKNGVKALSGYDGYEMDLSAL